MGRTKRFSAAAPIDVPAGFDVAGQGPPWFCAQLCPAPVVHPFSTTRPTFAARMSMTSDVSASEPSAAAQTAATRAGCKARRPACSSSVVTYSTTTATAPKHSSSSRLPCVTELLVPPPPPPPAQPPLEQPAPLRHRADRRLQNRGGRRPPGGIAAEGKHGMGAGLSELAEPGPDRLGDRLGEHYRIRGQ